MKLKNSKCAEKNSQAQLQVQLDELLDSAFFNSDLRNPKTQILKCELNLSLVNICTLCTYRAQKITFRRGPQNSGYELHLIQQSTLNLFFKRIDFIIDERELISIALLVT